MYDLDGRRRLVEQEEVVAQLLAGLLNAGLSTSDAIALGRAAAVKLGLDAVEFVDLGRSVLIQHGHPDGQVCTVSRPVGLDSIDCEQLRALTLVCKQISVGELDIQTAPDAIQRAMLITANKWWALIGLAILAFCIALQEGANWMTALGASLDTYKRLWFVLCCVRSRGGTGFCDSPLDFEKATLGSSVTKLSDLG